MRVLIGVVVWWAGASGWAAETAGALATPLRVGLLDREGFRQWADGAEGPVPEGFAKNGPREIVWTQDGRPEWRWVEFGTGRAPGLRHLRIGFTEPVPVGAVLVRGGGRLSVLRRDAPYPGDLADDAIWLPAQRLTEGRSDVTPVDREQYAVWLLPPGMQTRALRFTHEGRPADREMAGWLGGVWVLPQRLANLAPQAIVSTSARPEAADKLTDETNNRTWLTWNNGDQGAAQPVTPDHAEWLVLAWAQPVTLQGLCLLWTGFAAAQVEAFTGPADESPLAAPPSQWQPVTASERLETWYPYQLGPNWLDFGRPVTTRAVRVRITAGPQSNHPHLADSVRSQRKVWLGEILALTPLGDAALATAILPRAAAAPPPIPVRFQLPGDGLVTLVIEDDQGRRIRNLLSETPFPAGDQVAWWDSSDDLLRDTDAARHGLYHVPARFVAPGTYRVRGLWRQPLKLIYELSVYNAGRPPWETADGTGCWMTNHTPPTSVAAVPGARTADGQPLLLLGAFVAEGGHGLQWLREDGTKVGGQGWVGGVWTGAPTLAVDRGADAVAEHLAYVGSVWEGELRLTAKTRTLGDQPVVKLKLGDDPPPRQQADQPRPDPLAGFDGGDRRFVLAGLGAHNGVLVASFIRQNELWLIDAREGAVLSKTAVDHPRGVAFDGQGRLLVLSGTRLLRFEAFRRADAGRPLPAPQVVVSAGLDDPRHVAVDGPGAFYITDRGRAHQVKVFTPEGHLVRTIGKPGTPAVGTYDPLRMNQPNGLAIDSQGRVWVAENDFHPKRISVWSAEGHLVQAFYGPGEYGGGGVLDPRDPTRFYYKGLEFRLDWQQGRDELVRVFYRPDDLLRAHYGHHAPDTPLYPAGRGGQRYWTSCYTYNPTNGAAAAFVWQDDPPVARLVAGAGSAHEWEVLKTEPFRPLWPAGLDPQGDRWRNPTVFCWADGNGDGRPQPEEVRLVRAESGGVTVMDDLALVFASFQGRVARFAPQGFSSCGAPRYDLTAPEWLADGAQRPASSGGDQALCEPGGWTVLTNAPQPYSNFGLGGVFRGQPRWSYPSLWPGLHASHEAAVPDRPGMIVGHTRLLGGWVRPRGEGGPLFGVNGNMGNMYLLTADGLFVGTLFHDIRLRPNWAMPAATRGMDVTDVSLHDENFWPSITQTADGRVYLVDGARTSLVRIDGLDTIRRLPEQSLTVTPTDLAKARDWYAAAEAARQAGALREPLRVAVQTTALVVDGNLDDWPATTHWVVIDRRGTRANFNSDAKPYDAGAAVCVTDGHLFVAFRTTEKELLKNSGEMPQAPFKTGGCLDVMLATDAGADPQRSRPVAGDVRLLVTRVAGQTRALLYRAVLPGTKEPVAFSSPWRTITLDAVEDISPQVQLAADGTGRYEFRVPLAVLGWQPVAGQTFRGDLGLLRGNGFQTLARVYWSNKATAITSDVPSEAELTPRLWGQWRMVNATDPASGR